MMQRLSGRMKSAVHLAHSSLFHPTPVAHEGLFPICFPETPTPSGLEHMIDLIILTRILPLSQGTLGVDCGVGPFMFLHALGSLL